MLLILLGVVCGYEFHTTQEEIREEIDKKKLLFGSTVRIEHQQSQFFLHSHLVSYGSGSGQQSVTGMQNDNDYNSLWTFKECWNQGLKKYGIRVMQQDDEIKCGDCIRLEHMLTNRNLHSHGHFAPFSGNQEVSAYGENGNGDEGSSNDQVGDDWLLECDKQGVQFEASMQFYLKHKLSSKYLRLNRKDNFNQKNCGYHCPIDGQLEVSASVSKGIDNKFKIHAGLFYTKPETLSDDYEQEGRHCNSYGQCDDIDDDDDEYETVIQKDL